MTVIVHPTDFSALANEALPWVSKMAQALDASVHCLHVVREQNFHGGLEMVPADALPSVEEMERRAKQRVSEYVAEHFSNVGTDVIGAVVTGSPFVQIVRYAREVSATLIVMSTHGHTGLKHMLMGSTTEAVLRKADCPVLSVRSADVRFEMP